MTTKITDHVERGLARLPMQFKGKPNFEAFLTVLLTPIQRLEDTLWQLLTERGIDNAVGAQLDTLGRIVGQPRMGLVDADYRRYVRARIAANKSTGKPEDLIAVALAVTGGLGRIEVSYHQPACVLVEVADLVVSASTGDALGVMLRLAVAAGVRLELVFSSFSASETFTFGTGPGFGVGHLAGE